MTTQSTPPAREAPKRAPRPPHEEEEVVGKAFDWALTRRLLRFLRPYRPQVRIAILLALALALLGLAGPYLIKIAIDEGIARNRFDVLLGASGLFLLVQMLLWQGTRLQNVRIAEIGQNVLHDIRLHLFDHLQALSLDFYDRRVSGRILSRLTNDIDALQQLLTSGTINLAADLLSLLGIMAILFWMHPGLALLTFTLVPVIALVVNRLKRRSRAAYRDVRKKVAAVSANLSESLSGVRVTKSFGREDRNLARFDRVNRDHYDAQVRAVAISSLFTPAVDLVSAVGVAMVLWYGGGLAMQGPHLLTVGTLVAFLNYVERFFGPIRSMSRLYNNMQGAMASAERIYEILDTPPSVQDAPDARPLPPVRGEVRFENVRFAYDETEVLHGISFTARAGETVALVGPTGAGKSTIINLIARLYDPTSGRVMIDGTDIKTVTMRSLRRQMGIVLQDSFLFSGTIRENIAYGREEATDAQVRAAARLVGADRFIERLPEGYETPVEERGQRLSVGQRQLVSFARAVLADPRILILDEATASIDAHTEMLIQEALREMLRGRTAFIIAHRLSTIVEADRILVIDGGRIVEQGRHKELLAKGGLYAALYARQFATPSETEAEREQPRLAVSTGQ